VSMLMTSWIDRECVKAEWTVRSTTPPKHLGRLRTTSGPHHEGYLGRTLDHPRSSGLPAADMVRAACCAALQVY
jgi:hypothetical protein